MIKTKSMQHVTKLSSILVSKGKNIEDCYVKETENEEQDPASALSA